MRIYSHLKRVWIPALVLALVALGFGCRPSARPAAAAGTGPIRAVASLPPLAFALDRICGSDCRVAVLLPAERNAHDYEPSPKALRALADTELWVASGSATFPLEARADRLLAAEPEDACRRIEFSESETESRSDRHDWLDPHSMVRFAPRLAEILAELRPEHSDIFRERARLFVAEIDQLVAEIDRRLDGREGTRLWVVHPAWGAFCSRWNLEQVALEHDGKEPSPRRLVELIDQARRERVQWFVSGPGESAASARVFARETGAERLPLDPLAYDWPGLLQALASALSHTPGES